MRGLLVPLLATALLAGCAGAPLRTASAIEPQAFEFREPVEPVLAWHSLGAWQVVLSPRTTLLDVTVPQGTLTVVVNQTLQAGAAYGIRIDMAGCVWDRPQSFVGIGQTIGADCGGLSGGAAPLAIAATAGALAARIEPMALVCVAAGSGWPCPAPSPIMTS